MKATSLSARRAWIEIRKELNLAAFKGVALRKESVDRNPVCYSSGHRQAHVALRKESVDRNVSIHTYRVYCPVALRKESVDRNVFIILQRKQIVKSLSARRAWIEIQAGCA